MKDRSSGGKGEEGGVSLVAVRRRLLEVPGPPPEADRRALDPVYEVEGLARPGPVLGGGDPPLSGDLPLVWGVTARILRHLFGEILGNEGGPEDRVRGEVR